MNHYSMEVHAKDTHHKLRQEARTHRLARQTRTGQNGPGWPSSTGKVVAAIIALASVSAAVVAAFGL